MGALPQATQPVLFDLRQTIMRVLGLVGLSCLDNHNRQDCRCHPRRAGLAVFPGCLAEDSSWSKAEGLWLKCCFVGGPDTQTSFPL